MATTLNQVLTLSHFSAIPPSSGAKSFTHRIVRSAAIDENASLCRATNSDPDREL